MKSYKVDIQIKLYNKKVKFILQLSDNKLFIIHINMNLKDHILMNTSIII